MGCSLIRSSSPLPLLCVLRQVNSLQGSIELPCLGFLVHSLFFDAGVVLKEPPGKDKPPFVVEKK